MVFAEWLSITHGDDGLPVAVLSPQAVDAPMIANTRNGGVAGMTGRVSPEHVTDRVMASIREAQFLTLPHPGGKAYLEGKAADPDRWLRGMRRRQARSGAEAG